MTSLVAGVMVVAGLFVLFGLSSRGEHRGGSCGACPGGCVDCTASTPESSVEVKRVGH
jgi:hypothetical protein